MTRSELIQSLHLKTNQLPLKDIELTVKVILESMCETLSNNGRIEIRGFGSFVLNYKPPRKGRNPRTGETVLVPAKYLPHFKMGRELKERVDIKSGGDKPS